MRRLVIIILLASCNPVKQVLNSKDKTERVVREYVKNHPPKNDTLYIPGEVILRDTSWVDSIPIPFPVNHTIREVRIMEKAIRDTIKITDRSMLEALNNRLTKLEIDYAELKADRDYWRQQARVRLYALILLIVIAIAGTLGWLWLKFQPRIKIEK